MLGSPLPYDDALALRDRMWEISPPVVRYDSLQTVSPEIVSAGLSVLASQTKSAKISGAPFIRPIQNFYQTDVISRK